MAIKTKLPTRNIEWTKVREEEHPDVEETPTLFLHHRGLGPDAVIFWGSQDALEAQRWLHSVAFARCSHPDCGIRVAKLGDECGNHGEKKGKKSREEVIYYYRGQIERGSDYHWVDGWSPAGDSGGVVYPWVTRREAQQAEIKCGRKAVFVREPPKKRSRK